MVRLEGSAHRRQGRSGSCRQQSNTNDNTGHSHQCQWQYWWKLRKHNKWITQLENQPVRPKTASLLSRRVPSSLAVIVAGFILACLSLGNEDWSFVSFDDDHLVERWGPMQWKPSLTCHHQTLAHLAALAAHLYHQHQRDEHDSHGYLNNYTNVLKIESYPRLSDRSHPISGTWTVSTFPNPTSRRRWWWSSSWWWWWWWSIYNGEVCVCLSRKSDQFFLWLNYLYIMVKCL